MATLIDRPTRQPQKPLEQPGQPPGRPPFDGRAPVGPNRRRDRIRAALYLFGPLGGVFLACVAAVLIALALVLGSGEPGPATGAAELVPGNALIYLHLSTDASRPAVQRALALNRRLPGSAAMLGSLTDRVDAMLSGSASGGVSFAADVRPWLGKEAALAVLNTPGARAGSLVVLDVRRRVAARRFLARVGARPDGSFRGVRLLTEPSGTMLAFVGHYLVLGQAASVESAIYVKQGRAPSLAATSGYRQVAGSEANGRVLDAYASADGIRRALLPRSGVLGDLGALLDQLPVTAASASVSPTAGGLRIDVHRTLSPRLEKLSGQHPVQFTPTLAELLPSGSTLLLDVKGLRGNAPRLLALAARAGIAGRLGPLLSRLGAALAAEGVNVRQVLSIFSGETAIGIAPGRDGSGPAPVIVTRTDQQQAVRSLLAGVDVPLTQVFAPPASGPGQVPEVNGSTVAGVTVHELSLAPGFGIDYAVAHGLVVISTGTAGIAGVFAHRHALSEARSFQTVGADHPGQVTSLVFFDLSQLLRLGEQTGLIGGMRQATLWPALEKIRAVGLASWRGASDTTTELQLQIP